MHLEKPVKLKIDWLVLLDFLVPVVSKKQFYKSTSL